MSNTRLIVSFLLIATFVSAFLAYIGAVYAVLTDPHADWEYLAFGPIFVAPFYAFFLVLGGLVFGIPTLILLRRLRLSTQPTWLMLTGTFAGLLGGALLFGMWLGIGALAFGAVYGAMGGLMSVVLWYQLIEKHISDA